MNFYKSVSEKEFKEIRSQERNFVIVRDVKRIRKNDMISFQEYSDGMPTGRSYAVRVKYVIKDSDEVGLKNNFNILMLDV